MRLGKCQILFMAWLAAQMQGLQVPGDRCGAVQRRRARFGDNQQVIRISEIMDFRNRRQPEVKTRQMDVCKQTGDRGTEGNSAGCIPLFQPV